MGPEQNSRETSGGQDPAAGARAGAPVRSDRGPRAASAEIAVAGRGCFGGLRGSDGTARRVRPLRGPSAHRHGRFRDGLSRPRYTFAPARGHQGPSRRPRHAAGAGRALSAGGPPARTAEPRRHRGDPRCWQARGAGLHRFRLPRGSGPRGVAATQRPELAGGGPHRGRRGRCAGTRRTHGSPSTATSSRRT